MKTIILSAVLTSLFQLSIALAGPGDGKLIELRVQPREQADQPAFNVIGPAQDGSRLIKFRGGYDTVTFAPKLTCGPSFCVSCQTGCSLKKENAACRFCSTGRLPFEGSLASRQIAEQLEVALSVTSNESAPRFRVVFAGMGDSSYNAEGVVGAMELIQQRHPNQNVDFVIATVGSPLNKFRELQDRVIESFEAGRLKKGTRIYPQLSLHSSIDEKRGFLIPPSKDMTTEEVVRAGVEFIERLEPWVGSDVSEKGYPSNLRLTLNYLMLGKLGTVFPGNTLDEDLERMRELIHSVGKEKIILRMSFYNPDKRDGGHYFEVPGEEVAFRWQDELGKDGIPVRIFNSEGKEIRGGCGQMVNDKWQASGAKGGPQCKTPHVAASGGGGSGGACR